MTSRVGRSDQLRRYAPLSVAAVAVLMALFILPNALSLPQTNPTQTAEYAPVPPNGNQGTQTGNVSSLALGQSSGVLADANGGVGPGGALPGAPANGAGAHPSQKDCVGSPPRQTEDPMSPPCVAYFSGSNFGSTYRGVTGNEVRILYYFDGGGSYGPTSQGLENAPTDAWFDLAKPPSGSEPIQVRALRAFQAYFNRRFQTYQRFVHFFVYFGTSASNSPEGRRADAAKTYAHVHPFASFAYTTFGDADAFVEAMAGRGVLNFGAANGLPSSYYARYPGLIWGLYPNLEYEAELFADNVCTEVVHRPVAFGAAADKGNPRVLGMVKSADSHYPSYTQFADLVAKKVNQCGGKSAYTSAFPVAKACGGVDESGSGNNDASAAATGIATFQQDHVTTILWPQGMTAVYSKVAAQQGYTPEWVVAGDGLFDNYWSGQCQDQTAWNKHAVVMSPAGLQYSGSNTPCTQAYQSASPNTPSVDVGYVCGGFTWYDDTRQLFTGIQVAGPKLTPQSVDQGFHAIPPVQSSDPHQPACYYLPGDYTCIKDAALGYWDANGQNPDSNSPGCWRMVDGGARRAVGHWPHEDESAAWTGREPCSDFNGDGLWP